MDILASDFILIILHVYINYNVELLIFEILLALHLFIYFF